MNLAFVLHLYQPTTQSESAFRAVVAECYLPLLKLLKNKNNCAFTLNVSLGILEQFEKYGYDELLHLLKDLVESEKVELTGSAAYHPLLTKLSEDYVYQQIILDEYALGYYFGSHQGFEGENSILIKNIKGFFSPEMAINKDLIKVLDDLKYEWVLADSSAIVEKKNTCLYKLGDLHTSIVARDTALSNMLAFKRDSNVDDVVHYIMNDVADQESVVVVLDGETFGHQNKEGILLLELLIEKLHQINVDIVTVSTMIAGTESETIDDINETTWAFTPDKPKDIYRFWNINGNEIHSLFWKLHKIVTDPAVLPVINIFEEGNETVPIWIPAELKAINNAKYAEIITLQLEILKSMQSDKFWWASNMTVYDKLLYSPIMIENAVVIYQNIADMINDEKISTEIKDICSKILGNIVR